VFEFVDGLSAAYFVKQPDLVIIDGGKMTVGWSNDSSDWCHHFTK